jgi:hypothetical protein
MDALERIDPLALRFCAWITPESEQVLEPRFSEGLYRCVQGIQS